MRFPRFLPLLVLPAATALAQPASVPPPPEKTLAALRLVNDHFMREFPDPGRPILRKGHLLPSNIWTRSVYYEGLMALDSIDPNPRAHAYAVSWGQSHHWDLVGGPTTRVADNQCCGQTYLALYAQDPRPERIRMLQQSLDGMVNSSKVDDWWWCDALQMAMPVFARMGAVRHDPRYAEKMYALYHDAKTRRGLYNSVDHLWWRDQSFMPPYREPNGRYCYWSRGNGWVLAALVRVLEILPADAPHREEYLRTFRDMAAALLPLQRPDGFWNVSLLDPAHFGGKEVTGTSLFAYGFATGVRLGLLPSDPYAAAAARAWNGMVSDAVHPDGFLGYVQGTGKEPSSSQPVNYEEKPDFTDFGTGCFLLAGSAIYRLSR